ncbi:MAG: type II toxin-antitoxin system PemK/MazF family toxin [Ignavibacteriales bacterium]|nr:type II toxin-antitoxin system PemK/MazF family toxin [Ignavibacteriales bacterium]
MEFRWNIFLANLDPVVGSEQGKTRPVLVVSEEEINQVLPVVNVLPITTRKEGRKIYANEVFLSSNISELQNDSIILCFQIRTLDKKRLTKQLGKIKDAYLQEEILSALSFQLGIL